MGAQYSALSTQYSIGIVIVSHSAKLAEGVVELAREMAGPDVRITAAGGLALPGQPLGTDAALIRQAIEQVYSEAGVVVLLDLGSALLSSELAVELLPAEWRGRIRLADAPLVEGAIAAAVQARLGSPLDRVVAEARGALAPKIAHLGVTNGPRTTPAPSSEDSASELRLVVGNRLGLHARPAARFVQTVGRFRARIEVRNLTTGTGPANGRSLTALATLGVRAGHEILVRAIGDDAQEALAAIAALAHASFGDVDDAPAVAAAKERLAISKPARRSLQGLPASPGIAIGPAHLLGFAEIAPSDTTGAAPEMEWAALESALERARARIESQRERAARELGASAAGIFEAQALLLTDEALLDLARASVFQEARSAAAAWRSATAEVADRFRALDDPYLRERAGDVDEVRRLVLAQLGGAIQPAPLGAPGIAIVRDLDAGVVAALDPTVVRGVCAAFGGPTSHGAILARALGIPAVVRLGDAVLATPECATLIVDGGTGTVRLNPTSIALRRYHAQVEVQRLRQEGARATSAGPAVTRDGTRIGVLANIGSVAEARTVVAAGGEGIGLLRTEFLFLDRTEAPGEDEQVASYRAIVTAAAGRPVVIRTLDAGGDKLLAYVRPEAVVNAALGRRGIRLSLADPELFRAQLRAIIRVAVNAPVKVMFPMVTTLAEWRAARDLLRKAQAEVAEGGREVPTQIPTGIMVEVPAAALAAGQFAAEVDFFSIGTNDLAQYVGAADRANGEVAPLADPFQPAVLRLIREVAEAAHARGKPVAVCGEMASDPLAVPLLIGLGIDELSVNPATIPGVKHAIAEVDTNAARALAEKAVALESAAEVGRLIGRVSERREGKAREKRR